jgi:hypothetical protein
MSRPAPSLARPSLNPDVDDASTTFVSNPTIPPTYVSRAAASRPGSAQGDSERVGSSSAYPPSGASIRSVSDAAIDPGPRYGEQCTLYSFHGSHEYLQSTTEYILKMAVSHQEELSRRSRPSLASCQTQYLHRIPSRPSNVVSAQSSTSRTSIARACSLRSVTRSLWTIKAIFRFARTSVRAALQQTHLRCLSSHGRPTKHPLSAL